MTFVSDSVDSELDDGIPTEQRHPSSADIDLLATRDVLRLINHEDAQVPGAVAQHLDELASIVDLAVAIVRAGGRVHYFGAGTSGRMAVLDAAEVPPTYGAGNDLIEAHIAGGVSAMTLAVEDAEDSFDDGIAAASTVSERDIVFGLAASGRTPYVAGALQEARSRGAVTIAITSNPRAPIAAFADRHVALETGPEIVTGSTRMKAGTAQKIVLHTISTAMMIRLGHTFSNLMVDVVPTNEKLRWRVTTMLREATGASLDDASAALDAAGNETKVALLSLLAESDVIQARNALREAEGSVRDGLASIIRGRTDPLRRGEGAVVGIDIGASGYRVDIIDQNGTPVRVAVGTTRPIVLDGHLEADAVVERVRDDLNLAASEGGSLSVSSLGVGIAGGSYYAASLPDIAARFAALVPDALVTCFPDSLAAYVGAFGFGPGVVLAAGTGAVAVGSDGEAILRQVDGAGYLLGDRGSGAWIGRAGLQEALKYDSAGNTGSERLFDRLMVQFGDPRVLVRELNSVPDRGSLLASFAPAVFEAATAGDAISLEILDNAACELAATAIAAGRDIADEVALVGGVFAGSQMLLSATRDLLVQAGYGVLVDAGPASGGAAEIARRAKDGGIPKAFSQEIIVARR